MINTVLLTLLCIFVAPFILGMVLQVLADCVSWVREVTTPKVAIRQQKIFTDWAGRE